MGADRKHFEKGILNWIAQRLAMGHWRTAVNAARRAGSGRNDDPLSNVIDVHIAKIRKKLGRNLIVTRHGHGYCIET